MTKPHRPCTGKLELLRFTPSSCLRILSLSLSRKLRHPHPCDHNGLTVVAANRFSVEYGTRNMTYTHQIEPLVKREDTAGPKGRPLL